MHYFRNKFSKIS